MTSPTPAPFGTWESPITPETITSQGITFPAITATPDGTIYVTEGRPAEQGRCCIVEWRNGEPRDVLPTEYSARTAVHGYGGGAFATISNGNLVFHDWKTHAVYILDPATCSVTTAVEPDPKIYYADFNAHPHKPECILAIREDQRSGEAINELVLINSVEKTVKVVVSGVDFYSHARFNPAGDRVSWIQWNHPDMPWTGTELFVAPWVDGALEKPVKLAGQAGEESVIQPRWGPDGTLFFVSDRSGYWQFYRWSPDTDGDEPRPIVIEGLEKGEFGHPEWLLASCTYVLPNPDTIVATWTHEAAERLVIIDLKTNTYTFPSHVAALTSIRDGSMALTSTTSIAVLASTPTSPSAVYHISLTTDSPPTILRSSTILTIPESFYSHARHISFPRTTPTHPDTFSHAFFLPPTNPNYTGPTDQLPPLIIYIHGGPTTHSDPGLTMMWQYYTTRGYAVAFVNYAGSSGYGRAYRTLLDGFWGLLDVSDAADCARYLISTGQVHPSRVGITGVSSGGYAALQAICDFPDLWAGAISISGISDVEALVADTHKFESHYAFRLLFDDKVPTTEEEKRTVYRARSPRFKADKIKATTLLLQGTEDEIVPLNQAQAMADDVERSGGVAKLVIFEGEGHGFPRKAENGLRAMKEEEDWWRASLGEKQ
ncbi:alpha/beta-hydrolase [Aspergillus sclerotiicarbonarius CBS 121057]|uniref:Alpha/beta-hydrolase n=1 Tax=Aspergillus sclerotiicarbonarius (strain CBS 121057 / IBT 28362) TaxID=1448318 RepID=A0A319E270_ASPSB|nr:alpha/beta-hydrolase [Aspergillus sclerotiicarbonarius CBS 121057]